MTCAWSRALIERIRTGDREAHAPGFWPDCTPLRGMLGAAFESFDAEAPPLLRTFVGPAQRFDLATSLAQHGCKGGLDALRAWLARVSGSRKGCVTLNEVTRHSEPFHRMIHTHLLAPLFAALGAPHGGVDTYAFIGAYGDTPFGPHTDDEHSLVLHLGPAPKRAHVWPTDRRRPREYSLRQGDLLFIPRGVRHVMHARGFSVTLGISIFPTSATERRLAALTGPEEVFFVGAGRRRSSVAISPTSRRLHLRTLESNGWVIARPRPVAVPVRLGDTRFRSPQGFPILVERRRDRSVVFARGRAFALDVSEGVSRSVGRLRNPSGITWIEFADSLGPEWDRPSARCLFNRLYESQAIEEVS